jgi:hypothetical protein
MPLVAQANFDGCIAYVKKQNLGLHGRLREGLKGYRAGLCPIWLG